MSSFNEQKLFIVAVRGDAVLGKPFRLDNLPFIQWALPLAEVIPDFCDHLSPAFSKKVIGALTDLSSSLLAREMNGQKRFMSMPEGEFRNRGAMSIQEFIQWSKIKRWKFYDEVRRGCLHPKKIGTRTVIFWPEAERWAFELPESGQGTDPTTPGKE